MKELTKREREEKRKKNQPTLYNIWLKHKPGFRFKERKKEAIINVLAISFKGSTFPCLRFQGSELMAGKKGNEIGTSRR